MRQTKVKRSNFLLTFQILVVLLLFGLQMFKSGIIDYSQTPLQNLEKEIINKQAIIKANNLKVYSDTNKSDVINILPFSSEIFVTAEYGDLYEIVFRDKQAYISKQGVKLINPNLFQPKDLTFKDLVPSFPENLQNSYELFFAQFGQSFDVIKSNLSGLVESKKQKNDTKIIEYPYHNVSIMFNDSWKANRIVIKNISVNSAFKKTLLEKAQLQSDDQSLFLIKSDMFIYIFDLYNKMLTIKAVSDKSSLNLAKSIYKMRNGKNVKILGYGDSITFGYTPFTGSQVSTTYLEELQNQLSDLYSNKQISVINRGIPGWQTDEGLMNFETNVLSENPDLVLIMFGINDLRGGKYGQPIPVESYKENLITIVMKAKQAGIDVFLLSPTPILDTNKNNQNRILEYVSAVKEVAANTNEPYIDLHREISEDFLNNKVVPIDLLPDKIHFKEDKYPLIAHKIIDGLANYRK